MNAEITDSKVENSWVLYDGACDICKGFVRRFAPALHRRGFECVPLQTAWVRERLNLSEDELMLEMRVLEPSGKVVGGAAGVLLLARTFWWALPLVWLSKIPGVFRLMDSVYRWAAARRYCANGACGIIRRTQDASRSATNFGVRQSSAAFDYGLSGDRPPHSGAGLASFRDSLPRPLRARWYVLLLPAIVAFLSYGTAPWVFMWAMAGALWLALKLFTLFDVLPRPVGRSLAYLAWPGMDAQEFFRNARTAKPTPRDWLFGALNIAVGTASLYVGARAAAPYSMLLAGWLGMVGIVMILHFGIFKCLGLVWCALGIPATPLMDAPHRSRSLSEFWGRRWNTGFSIPARRYLMEPISRRFGTVAGLLAVFFLSGFVHELVISVPAGGGYGLPTLYFFIQGLALMLERSQGTSRWLTLLSVAGPAFILFHPPFVHGVVLPFLNAIGVL